MKNQNLITLVTIHWETRVL